MEKKRLRIFKAFVIAYLFSAAALVYLLYFNFGLAVEGKTNLETGSVEIIVKNNSIHLISGIKVYYLNNSGIEEKVEEIESLSPKQEKQLNVSRQHAVDGVITLIARASHHLSVSKQVKIEELGSGDLSVEVQAPAKAFKNSDFAVMLTTCNLGMPSNSIKVEVVSDNEFFASSQEEKTVPVEIGKCRELKYTFNSKKTGKTTIYFNITVGEVNKRVEKIVEIIGVAGNA